jgi:hypothetical protein
MLVADTLISAIILAAFLILRVLVLYAFNVHSQKGFKKSKIVLSMILSLVSVINLIDSYSSYLSSIARCGTLDDKLRPFNA